MRLNRAEQRGVETERRPAYEQDTTEPPLMTPARRAALEALEREFAQLLAAQRG